MNQPIQEPRLDLERRANFFWKLFVKVIGDEVEGLSVVLDFSVQAS